MEKNKINFCPICIPIGQVITEEEYQNSAESKEKTQ